MRGTFHKNAASVSAKPLRHPQRRSTPFPNKPIQGSEEEKRISANVRLFHSCGKILLLLSQPSNG